jgi:hypothetical protein
MESGPQTPLVRFRTGDAHGVDDRCVVQLIAHHDVLLALRTVTRSRYA